MSMSPKLRVQYVHGLESSAKGYKSTHLMKVFGEENVCSVQMDTSNPNQCLLLQEKAIRDFSPDVLVGSSFGGGLCFELIRRSIWKGPTLFLAPAVSKTREMLSLCPLSEFSKKSDETDLSSTKNSGVLIVHGTLDELIPLEEARLLFQTLVQERAKNSNSINVTSLNVFDRVKLTEIEDDHYLKRIVDEKLLENYVQEVYDLHRQIKNSKIGRAHV